MEMMQALKVDGLGDADHCSLVRHYEKMAHIEGNGKSPITREGRLMSLLPTTPS